MPSPTPLPIGGPPRLLLVEDDPVVQAMLGAWLHTEGCAFEVAPSLRVAKERLAAGEFDLLLSDIKLPDGEGPELVAALEGANHGLPVIFLTGQPSLETAMQSVKLRVAAYLVKPPDLDELRGLVRREVAAHRHRRVLASTRLHLQAWDRELARLEQVGVSAGPRPLQDYLQLSLRHFATVLGGLERSVAALGGDAPGRATLTQIDLVAGLQRAVQVLEQTREHFKSKELGDLRRDLDSLLRAVEPGADQDNSLKR